MEGFAYFPAIVYRDERPDYVGKFLPLCRRYLDDVRDDKALIIQSTSLSRDPGVKDLADYLLLSSADILRSQGYDTGRYDFYIQGLWVQEIRQGYGTNIHVHKDSQICGWFFLETPVGGSYPIYHDTRINKAMIELDYIRSEEVTNATNAIHFNNVKPGTVLFGNSWMSHQLSNSNTDKPTRCIHFIISHKVRQCTTC